MRSLDGKSFLNISATTGQFYLEGGEYGAVYMASWGSGGSVTLQILGPDGSTWIAVTAAWLANGTAVLALPPGNYRFAITTATGVYVNLARIPGE